MTVRNYLQTLINDGLTAGDPVPSERELCELFDVSRMTVRQAIDTLIVDGVLERQQGRGTFVAPPKLDLQLRLTSFTEEMNRRGMLAGSRVLAAETIPANDEFADALELSLGAPVHYLRRLRTADSDPMAIEESWLSADTLPNFLELAGRRSLYATLLEQDKRPNWEKTQSRHAASPPKTPPCSKYRLIHQACTSPAAPIGINRQSCTPNPCTEQTGTPCGCQLPTPRRRTRPPSSTLKSLFAEKQACGQRI